MTRLLSRTTRILDGRKKVKMDGRTYLKKIVPIGFMYSGSLVCNNVPYMTLSVAFVQMLKVRHTQNLLVKTQTDDTWRC